MSSPWRGFWEEVEGALVLFEESQARAMNEHFETLEVKGALVLFEESQARAMNEYLGTLRRAIAKYGQAVDPDSFDEYGQPIEVDG